MYNTKLDPLIEVLKREFESKKARNSFYSLRAFSKFLDIDPSNLSKLLHYQITPGYKLREKLAKKLGFDPNDMMNPLTYQKTGDANYINHNLELFSIISDWQHYAILELIKLSKYKDSVSKASISRDLCLSQNKVDQAIERLVQMNLISVNEEKGTITNNEESSSSILQVDTSKAHRNQQKQILEKAIDALDSIPVERRSQSSMTIAIDKEKLPEAIDMIKDFRRKLARFLSESSDLNDVYHLSVSLYPVTTIHQEVAK